MPAVSEAAKGERCLIGCAVQDNYKTLVGSALADSHNILLKAQLILILQNNEYFNFRYGF